MHIDDTTWLDEMAEIEKLSKTQTLRRKNPMLSTKLVMVTVSGSGSLLQVDTKVYLVSLVFKGTLRL